MHGVGDVVDRIRPGIAHLDLVALRRHPRSDQRRTAGSSSLSRTVVPQSRREIFVQHVVAKRSADIVGRAQVEPTKPPPLSTQLSQRPRVGFGRGEQLAQQAQAGVQVSTRARHRDHERIQLGGHLERGPQLEPALADLGRRAMGRPQPRQILGHQLQVAARQVPDPEPQLQLIQVVERIGGPAQCDSGTEGPGLNVGLEIHGPKSGRIRRRLGDAAVELRVNPRPRLDRRNLGLVQADLARKAHARPHQQPPLAKEFLGHSPDVGGSQRFEGGEIVQVPLPAAASHEGVGDGQRPLLVVLPSRRFVGQQRGLDRGEGDVVEIPGRDPSERLGHDPLGPPESLGHDPGDEHDRIEVVVGEVGRDVHRVQHLAAVGDLVEQARALLVGQQLANDRERRVVGVRLGNGAIRHRPRPHRSRSNPELLVPLEGQHPPLHPRRVRLGLPSPERRSNPGQHLVGVEVTAEHQRHVGRHVVGLEILPHHPQRRSLEVLDLAQDVAGPVGMLGKRGPQRLAKRVIAGGVERDVLLLVHRFQLAGKQPKHRVDESVGVQLQPRPDLRGGKRVVVDGLVVGGERIDAAASQLPQQLVELVGNGVLVGAL